MARKKYETPIVDIMVSSGGGSGDVQLPESQNAPFYPQNASYSAWRMAVQNANLDIGVDYGDYVKWMTENGYGTYIQPDDSELK